MVERKLWLWDGRDLKTNEYLIPIATRQLLVLGGEDRPNIIKATSDEEYCKTIKRLLDEGYGISERYVHGSSRVSAWVRVEHFYNSFGGSIASEESSYLSFKDLQLIHRR